MEVKRLMIYKDKYLKKLKMKWFVNGFCYGLLTMIGVFFLYQFLTSNPLEWIL